MTHKHVWSKRYKYWQSSNKGFGKLFTQQKEKGSKSVWIRECLVCHIIKDTPRAIKKKLEDSPA